MERDNQTGISPEPLARWWAVFERLDRGLLQLERLGMAFAAVVLAGMFTLLMAGVFARPWTGIVFSVALEVGSMSMWSITYMGAAFIWRTYGHVQFDLFLRLARGRRHHLLQLMNNFAALIIGIAFAWFAWESFQWQFRSGASTQNLRFPFWPGYWPAFVGLSLLAAELAFSCLRSVRQILHPTGSEELIYGDARPPVV